MSSLRKVLRFFSTLVKLHTHAIYELYDSRMHPDEKFFSKSDFHEIDDVLAQNFEKLSAKV